MLLDSTLIQIPTRTPLKSCLGKSLKNILSLSKISSLNNLALLGGFFRKLF